MQVHRHFVEDKTNPFPGVLSGVRFSSFVDKKLWAIRAALKNHWIFRAHLHGELMWLVFRVWLLMLCIGIFTAKSKIQLNDVLGFVIGVATIALYNMNGKSH